MGSPVSPIVANLYMQYFEQKALSTATNLPRIWLRYVGDTCVIQTEDHKQHFLELINSVGTAIGLKWKTTRRMVSSHSLILLINQKPMGKLSITVYRKPSHMEQYLQWESHHHLSARYSVINTLTQRAKTVCNKLDLLQKEMEHLKKALTPCKYPKWALDRVERRLTKPTSEVSNEANKQSTAGAQPTTNEVKTKGCIVIHYTQDLCESIEKICSRYDKQTHFKGNSMIKNLLVSPKDKDPMENKSGAIYCFQCGDLACDEEYIEDTSRTFGERFKEHLKEPSHSNDTSHSTTQVNFQIIGREDHGIARTIKESIYIRVNNPTQNRNIGKFNLHHIFERVLLNTFGLKIKRHAHDTGHGQSTQPNSLMQFFTGSMEHAQRTPLFDHAHRTS